MPRHLTFFTGTTAWPQDGPICCQRLGSPKLQRETFALLQWQEVPRVSCPLALPLSPASASRDSSGPPPHPGGFPAPSPGAERAGRLHQDGRSQAGSRGSSASPRSTLPGHPQHTRGRILTANPPTTNQGLLAPTPAGHQPSNPAVGFRDTCTLS